MKILIAVTNCWMYRNRQQVIRDTWFQKIPAGFHVRFFLGRTPHQKPLAADEIQVDVDDGYPGLPAKTREMCRYALANGYSHLFKCDDDVYVQLDRLAASDFAQLGHYVGRLRGPSGKWTAPYASGFSYWLDTKAMKVIADATLTDDPAEDRWVGNTLLQAGIRCVPDYRYVVIVSQRNAKSYNEGPRKGNNVISACEFPSAQQMMLMHSQWANVASLSGTNQKVETPHPLRKVAIVIKTFLRDGYLVRCLEGIKSTLPEAKIVVVDDGLESPYKITKYATMRLDGHAAVWLPFDSGFGAKSNEAVKHCDREFVLIGSDDFAFGQQHVRADVIRMVQTLEQTDLDIVSGRVNGYPYEATLRECGDEVFEKQGYHGDGNCTAGPFKHCDLTVNYSLIKRPLLDCVHWDGDVKIGGGEHGMFFLDVQRAGGKVAYLPGVNISELPRNVPGWFHKDYPMYRSRAKEKARPCALRRGINKYHLMGGTIEVSQ